MTQIQGNPNEDQLRLESIAVTLHGISYPITRQDAAQLARATGQLVQSFTLRVDGYTDTMLGPYHITAGNNRISVSRPLDTEPATAELGITETCQNVAVIAANAPREAIMAVIRLTGTIPTQVSRPDVARFITEMAPESNQVEPASTPSGTEFPAWHRITPSRETGPNLREITFTYHATAALVTAATPSANTLEDVALTLLDTMIANASRRHLEADTTDLTNPAVFDSLVRDFPNMDDQYRREFLELVANTLTAQLLRMPADELTATVQALWRLARMYEDLGNSQRAPRPENDTATSIELLSRISDHNRAPETGP